MTEEEKKAAMGEDPVITARRLALTHKLEDAFMGSGICQRNAVSIKIPPDEELANTYSMLSLSNLDEFRINVEAAGNQLPPYDLEAAAKANE